MNETITVARHWISHVLEWSLMILALWLPIRYLFRTGSFLGAVLRMWLGIICWAVLLCGLLPLTIFATTRDPRTFDFFPSTSGVVAVVLAGWAPALFYCSLAFLCRALWLRWQRARFRQPSGPTAPS